MISPQVIAYKFTQLSIHTYSLVLKDFLMPCSFSEITILLQKILVCLSRKKNVIEGPPIHVCTCNVHQIPAPGTRGFEFESVKKRIDDTITVLFIPC